MKGICRVCGVQATDTHEIIGRGAYASVKEGYAQKGNQWELCQDHHTQGGEAVHRMGAKSFAIKHGLFEEYLTAVNLKNAWDKKRYHSVKRIE